MSEPEFTDAERSAVYRAIAERRDMRRFVPGSTVAPQVLSRLLAAAHAAIRRAANDELDDAVAYAEAGTWEPVEDLARDVLSPAGTEAQ